jgi:hypothetical protein
MQNQLFINDEWRDAAGGRKEGATLVAGGERADIGTGATSRAASVAR